MKNRKKDSLRNSYTIKQETKCGTMKIIFDMKEIDGNEYLDGISILIGKSKVCANCQAIAHSAYINYMLDHGIPLTEIAKTLSGINACMGIKEGMSCPEAIGKALMDFIREDTI